MANERSSPWADWKPLGLPSEVLWFNSVTTWPFAAGPLPFDYTPDPLDTFAVSPEVAGGAIWKPAFGVGPGQELTFGYEQQIALPDFITKLNGRVEWSGRVGAPMAADGSNRVGLEIEHFMGFDADLVAPFGAPLGLSVFSLAVKFRGYGAQVANQQTQDVYVGPAGFGQATSAFPQMAVPLAPFLFDPARGFYIARVRHIVEIPSTVAPGDFAEMVALIRIGAAPVTQAMSFFNSRRRFVRAPFSVEPNTGAQLTGDQGQARTDNTPYAS